MKLYDRDIREPLFDFLEQQEGKVRFLEEMIIGKSRADIVMVRETDLTGIEIKSDMDTYVRLSRQVKDYNRYFDRNIVVVGKSHAAHIEEHVPEWWGIIVVELIRGNQNITYLRQPGINPKNTLKKKLSLLWRPELSVIQNVCGMYKYKDKSKRFVQEKILENVDSASLHLLISEAFFERDYTLIAQEIASFRQEKKKDI